MAVTRYCGDRLISTSASDSYPTDVLEGAELYSIPLRVKYSFHNSTWNPIESGVAGLVSGQLANTIYNMGTQWSGGWNIWNNNDLIGFGFITNNPQPLNKGHFYAHPSGYIAGWVTGIILENQSNTGAFEDWGDLTVMTNSGDWGDLTAMTSSGSWGNILDPTTPAISIDVKLSQDRSTVAAIRFRRLVSGSSNLDAATEFWVMDSGTLLPKFWIRSGQFLPWLSGKEFFLGAPDLTFSGVHTEKTVCKQVQLLDGVIPSSGNNVLSSTSGKLYWSGQQIAILSGNTENGLIVYNEDYPNAFVQTGVVIINNKLGVGKNTTPSYTIEAKEVSASIGINSTTSSAELDMVNSVQDRCFLIYSGTKFEHRIGSAGTATITIVGGAPGNVGFRTNEPRGDIELLRNSIAQTQDDTYGISLRNDTAASATLNQYSPPLLWRGAFRNPTGLNSLSSEFRTYILTDSGNNPLVSGSGALVFEAQRNSSGYKELMRLDYDAGIKLPSNKTFDSGIVFVDHKGGLMSASGMSFDTGINVLKIKTISGNQTRYHVGGTLFSTGQISDISDGSIVETLSSHTIPGLTLSNVNDRIKVYSPGAFNSLAGGTKRLILEAYNSKLVDIASIDPNSTDGWKIEATIYKKNNNGTVGADVMVMSGTRIVQVTYSFNLSGLSTSDGHIRFRSQSGITQYSTFIDFYPSNP